MDLFNTTVSANILPYDGTANYCGKIIDRTESRIYFEKLLLEIPWKRDVVVLFGKQITTRRKVAWIADPERTYAYSKTTKNPLPWSHTLLDLKKKVEEKCGVCFNSCLANLYHDGNEGMSWHADDERELEPEGTIASLSLGVSRDFLFKHKTTRHRIRHHLETGSLLIMKGAIQKYWLHSLPKRKKVKTARINLTFRNIVK